MEHAVIFDSFRGNYCSFFFTNFWIKCSLCTYFVRLGFGCSLMIIKTKEMCYETLLLQIAPTIDNKNNDRLGMGTCLAYCRRITTKLQRLSKQRLSNRLDFFLLYPACITDLLSIHLLQTWLQYPKNCLCN